MGRSRLASAIRYERITVALRVTSFTEVRRSVVTFGIPGGPPTAL
jgi:hypothetical protein